jgi:benzoyl-CoA 2,3-epoxidase subunit A
MSQLAKQHLIDPEICIRCYTCENTCPIDAITHNDDNVVVDFDRCNYCMDCIPVCPTGSIDEWRVVSTPYSLEQQFEFDELPAQEELEDDQGGESGTIEALDDEIAKLLAEAHSGAGGKTKAPESASKPSVNLYNLGKPIEVTVQGNYRLTDDPEHDVRHLILDAGSLPLPLLEGQSVGVLVPGLDEVGKAHLPRLYSISSPRDGERPNYNNFSLTVKREEQGLCSNFLCDLKQGDKVKLTGPFGSTFLVPNDPEAKLLMICTGTGSAPFRAFTMNKQRTNPDLTGAMSLVFGARTEASLPYFGPLNKIPESFLRKHFAFSRSENQPKRYVQDDLKGRAAEVLTFLQDPNAYVYICGLRAMEEGVEAAFSEVATGLDGGWETIKAKMREEGRYHVETY